ncbi:MAG: hypothetical protein Q4B48_08895, partial [Syntrophomonadaceae bacterium]|nr:hypothetical protein [Syntrophomonadaceae bacterium]
RQLMSFFQNSATNVLNSNGFNPSIADSAELRLLTGSISNGGYVISVENQDSGSISEKSLP